MYKNFPLPVAHVQASIWAQNNRSKAHTPDRKKVLPFNKSWQDLTILLSCFRTRMSGGRCTLCLSDIATLTGGGKIVPITIHHGIDKFTLHNKISFGTVNQAVEFRQNLLNDDITPCWFSFFCINLQSTKINNNARDVIIKQIRTKFHSLLPTQIRWHCTLQ